MARIKKVEGWIRILGICGLLVAAGCRSGKTDADANSGKQDSSRGSRATAGMVISCPDFQAGQAIPARFTCDGENLSPALQWSGVPEQAKSLVLICEDPDAPGGTFVHWAVVNLPPRSTGVAAGGPVPQGAVELFNDFGKKGYGGPCPPNGTHRYFFKLAALDVPELVNVTRQTLGDLMPKHVLAQAETMGTYQRKK